MLVEWRFYKEKRLPSSAAMVWEDGAWISSAFLAVFCFRKYNNRTYIYTIIPNKNKTPRKKTFVDH